MSSASPTTPEPDIPWRTILLLAITCFASSANLRVADALLAQVADDFRVTVGQASSIVAAFAVSYGLLQAVYGPVGDRLGKLRVVAFGSGLAALLTGACATMASLAGLTTARFLAGAAAAAIIPLAMAWIGDMIPFERRQPVLARFLSGQMMGLVFGQAAGGFVGDLLGWRGAFAMLAILHALATVVLVQHLRSVPGLEFERRLKLPALRNDLRVLGVPASQWGVGPETALPVLGSVEQALGFAYVLEGATLGGRVIRKRVAAAGGSLVGLSFFDVYGPATGEQWVRFCAVLERQCKFRIPEAVEGALAGFRFVRASLLEQGEPADLPGDASSLPSNAVARQRAATGPA